MMTNKSVPSNIAEIEKSIVDNASVYGFKVLYSAAIHTPDYVRKDSKEHCGYHAHLIILSSANYTNMITSFSSKYLVAGFLRIGIYESPEGINVVIADTETINKIVFNDLYESGKEEIYNKAIIKTTVYKDKLIELLHKSVQGEKVKTIMEPIRDDDDLAESSKDMFMMIGKMTLFNDEDQFPLIYSTKNSNGFDGLQNLKNKFVKNLLSFKPSNDDIKYRWYPNPDDLNWKIVSELVSPQKDAILLGITRPRTEAVSFHIAGSSREKEGDLCPGIDHLIAYPIEILLIQEDETINVYTQRQMIRMDMYFGDAGMSAFMNHMSMPGNLDISIKKALLGNEFKD